MKFSFNPTRFHWVGFFYAITMAAVGLMILPHSVGAQFKFREPPNRSNPSALSEVDGETIWQQFLQGRNLGVFSFQGNLIHRPRNSSSQTYRLSFEGDWSEGEQLSEIVLTSSEGGTRRKSLLSKDSRVYDLEVTGGTCQGEPIDPNAFKEPMFPGLPFSLSDLLMPYLDWPGALYVAPDRYMGRPAHRFSLSNPVEGDSPAKVVVLIDEDYAALLKVDLYDSNENLLTRLRVGGFKKFGADWMFSELLWSHRTTRESLKLELEAFELSTEK